MTTATKTPARLKRRGPLPVVGLLLLGVIVIPAALALLTTSSEAPDAEAHLRMAFATVAGQTIAIVTVVGLLIASIVRRLSIGAVLANALIAVIVISLAATGIGNAMSNALRGLGIDN